MNVRCNDLGQETAKRIVGVLQENRVLTAINLDYNPKLGNTEVRDIARSLRTHGPSLESISFSDNNVGNDVAGAFARSIGDDATLIKRLSIAHNCLRSTGVSRIAGSLKNNTVMVYLDLGRNPMGGKGMAHLAEALKENNCLRELLVDCCGIDVEGARGLADALKVNSSLTKLDVSDNSLLTKGVIALSGGLAGNTSIVDLNLTNVGVGVKATEKLAEAMAVNGVLEVLNLSNNQVRNHGCKKLSEMLTSNHVLRTLNLSFNSISAIGIEAMVDAMATTSGIREGLKALDLDVILLGNQYSKDPGVVDNSQVMVPPKMARSKLTWENATDDSLDRTMWSKKEENSNIVRRPSFSIAAGEEFDLDDGKSRFSMTNNLLSSAEAGERFGVIAPDMAEPVEVPRWRQLMEDSGNRVKTEGGGKWSEKMLHVK